VIVLAEHYYGYERIYYSDGHYEITTQRLKKFIEKNKGVSGYKNPILIQDSLLFPTMNIKYQECRWLNLDYLEEQDDFFIHLLKEKDLLMKSKSMYLRYKEKQFLKDSFW